MNTDQFFAKEDTSDDSLFYEIPRLVTHIDDNACMVLKGFYRSLLKDGDSFLDYCLAGFHTSQKTSITQKSQHKV